MQRQGAVLLPGYLHRSKTWIWTGCDPVTEEVIKQSRDECSLISMNKAFARQLDRSKMQLLPEGSARLLSTSLLRGHRLRTMAGIMYYSWNILLAYA